MPKNSKTEQTNGSAPAAENASPAADSSAKPKKPAKAAKSARKTLAKKISAKGAAKKPAARKSAKKRGYEPSDEDIRIRAYFIAERRVQMSMAGDSAQDWIDARQQLIDEYSQRRS